MPKAGTTAINLSAHCSCKYSKYIEINQKLGISGGASNSSTGK
jgi:hypothetical protein